jgi:hypothetical protein
MAWAVSQIGPECRWEHEQLGTLLSLVRLALSSSSLENLNM